MIACPVPNMSTSYYQIIVQSHNTLAAHELARTRIANGKQLNFTPFKKNQKVWLDMRNLKMNHHEKDRPKTRRTIWNWRSLRTCDLSIKAPDNMEDSQCIPCHLAMTLHRKQNIWKQLPQTTTWITWRRRSIRSRNHPQTLKKRKRVPILCEMERISNHQSHMGIRISFLWWRKHAPVVQRSIPTLTQKGSLPIGQYWTKESETRTLTHIYNQTRTTIDSSLKPPLPKRTAAFSTLSSSFITNG